MSATCVQFISFVVLCYLAHLIVCATTPANRRDESHKGDITYPDDLNVMPFSKQNLMMQPHNHHHGPDFHHHHGPDFHHHHDYDFHYHQHSPKFHHGPSSDRNFNDEEGNQPKAQEQGDSSRQIPLEFIQNLNNYTVNDLLLNFVEGEEDEGPFIINRFGENEGQERSAATMPKGADCMPELTTVKMVSSDDPSILYIPACTRIERCGGCCKHDLLSCQPLKKETIPFKAYKTQYTGDKKLKFLGTEVIMVEKHNKCKCLCQVKPEDCSQFQEYRETECRCACVNHDERKKCSRNPDKKLWNPDLCTCQCRDNMQCSTGSYFDQNDCRCVAVPMNRRVGNYQRRSYRSEPLAVVPLEED